MYRILCTNYMFILYLVIIVIVNANCVAAQENINDNSRVLVVVPVTRGVVDQSVLRKFDKLVIELRKISKNKIIKLECRYHGQPDHERDVMAAYQIAGKIEKYLREHHKLDLDLWISIRLGQVGSTSAPTLAISLFADDIKRLDAIQIDPLRPKTE